MKQKTIAIFGSSKPAPLSEEYHMAYEIGYCLANEGYSIVNGGYDGIMTASAEGAAFSDQPVGITGITCSQFGRSGPNPFIINEIQTSHLMERLNRLIEIGDGYIVLPGGTGTLLELAAIWELTNKRFLQNVPIICMTDYWKIVVETIVAAGESDGKSIHFAYSAQDVVRYLKKYFSKSQ